MCLCSRVDRRVDAFKRTHSYTLTHNEGPNGRPHKGRKRTKFKLFFSFAAHLLHNDSEHFFIATNFISTLFALKCGRVNVNIVCFSLRRISYIQIVRERRGGGKEKKKTEKIYFHRDVSNSPSCHATHSFRCEIHSSLVHETSIKIFLLPIIVGRLAAGDEQISAENEFARLSSNINYLYRVKISPSNWRLCICQPFPIVHDSPPRNWMIRITETAGSWKTCFAIVLFESSWHWT